MTSSTNRPPNPAIDKNIARKRFSHHKRVGRFHPEQKAEAILRKALWRCADWRKDRFRDRMGDCVLFQSDSARMPIGGVRTRPS